jgi:subtilisin family serine protease
MTFLAALVVSLLPVLPASVEGPIEDAEGAAPYAADHVLVEAGAGVAAGLAGDLESLGNGWHRVDVPPGADVEEYVEELEERPDIVSAEVDLEFRPLVTLPFVPNDPLYTSGAGNGDAQWHLHSLDLVSAWTTTAGDGAVVAVLDSGISPGPDGFCHGFVAEHNAVTGDSGPGSAPDDDGHGTHVAGSVAQCSGNGFGGAGVATDARIMPVDVFLGDVAFASDIAAGIDHAVDNGADVINLSLGIESGSSELLNQAIARALEANVVVVAAAGNTGGPVFYPASHPGVIGVGATTIGGGVAGYSSRGLGLDVVAPGGSDPAPIWQEVELGYAGTFGTSMASAHVSGVVALMRARYPQANHVQVRNALACGAADVGTAGWDEISGFGRVRAGQAVSRLGQMVSTGAITCGPQAAAGSKVAVVQSTNGIWRMYLGANQVWWFFYGVPGDLPFMGDWNCDGVDTPGLYRQSNGFVYLRNSNTPGFADVNYFFGIAGDIPVAGDFDGDGCDTVSIYRPSQARFYIINSLGSGGSGPVADYSFLYGVGGDVPFVGDWNGDGVDTPGLRRPSNGFVYLRNSNSQGFAQIEFFYGVGGDVVFAGDWDASGGDSIGLFRPSNGNIYLRNQLSTGNADLTFFVGSGIRPTAGDF